MNTLGMYITVPKAYYRALGDLTGAWLLHEIEMRTRESIDNGDDGWFAKSYEEWEQEVLLSKYQVKARADVYVARDFVETVVKKDEHGVPKVHYKANLNRLGELMRKGI